MERTIFWSTIAMQGKVMTSFDKVFKVLQADDVDFAVVRPLVTSLIAALDSIIPETDDVENANIDALDDDAIAISNFVALSAEEVEQFDDEDTDNITSEVTVELAEENLDDFSEHLLKAAEAAVESGENELMFRGIRMIVSRAQIMGMKCLRNKLIQKTKDSLEKRFLSDEIKVLTAITKILSPSSGESSVFDSKLWILGTNVPVGSSSERSGGEDIQFSKLHTVSP